MTQDHHLHSITLLHALRMSCTAQHLWVSIFDPAAFQDDATVESLSACDKHSDKHGWAQRAHAWLFEGDIFAGVASDPKLMRIHSTAEEFDHAAEETLIPFQVALHAFSLAHFSHLPFYGCSREE